MKYLICFISMSLFIGCNAQTVVSTPTSQPIAAPVYVPAPKVTPKPSPTPTPTYTPFPQYSSDNTKYDPFDLLSEHVTYIDDPANAAKPLATLHFWVGYSMKNYDAGGTVRFAITINGVSTSCKATVVVHDAPMNTHRVEIIGIEESKIAPVYIGIDPWLYVTLSTFDPSWFEDKNGPCYMASGFNGLSFIHYGGYAKTAVDHMQKFTSWNY